MGIQALLATPERRRKWSRDQKEQIVFEAFFGDQRVVDVAKRYQMHPQQVHKWRRELCMDSAPGPLPCAIPAGVSKNDPKKAQGGFVAVQIGQDPRPDPSSQEASPIELKLANGRELRCSSSLAIARLQELVRALEAL